MDSVADVTDWVELGHQLDVDPVKLTELQQCGRSSESCREELLIFWARKDERASWEKLVRALDRMDEHLASQKIKEKYMASPPPLVEGILLYDYQYLYEVPYSTCLYCMPPVEVWIFNAH